MKATWTKLRSGEWGVRVEARDPVACMGQKVEVSKKDGSTSSATLAKLVWHKGEIALWAIEPKKKRETRREELCAECGEYPASTEAEDSSGIVAPVCGRCAEMPFYQRSFA